MRKEFRIALIPKVAPAKVEGLAVYTIDDIEKLYGFNTKEEAMDYVRSEIGEIKKQSPQLICIIPVIVNE